MNNKNPAFDPIMLNGRPLEEVTSAKCLDMNISNDLKWNAHVLELLTKASSQLYFLSQIKRLPVASIEL